MEKQNPIRKNVFLWADAVIVATTLACTAYFLCETYDYLSFGGFASLFLLVVLTPQFLALGAALTLLVMSAKMRKKSLAIIAAGVQIMSPIPWLLIKYAFGPTASSDEVLMVVCILAGVLELLMLLTTKGKK